MWEFSSPILRTASVLLFRFILAFPFLESSPGIFSAFMLEYLISENLVFLQTDLIPTARDHHCLSHRLWNHT